MSAADKLAAFEAKMEAWRGERLRQYAADAEFRTAQDAKHGGSAGYERSLQVVVDQKLASARAKAAAAASASGQQQPQAGQQPRSSPG